MVDKALIVAVLVEVKKLFSRKSVPTARIEIFFGESGEVLAGHSQRRKPVPLLSTRAGTGSENNSLMRRFGKTLKP